MRRFIFAACMALLAAPVVGAQDPDSGVGASLDASARTAWDEIRYDLSEIVERLHKHKDLPDASIWHPMRNDKASNQSRINKLMNEALSHLNIAKLSDYRQTYADLGTQIAENQKLVGEHMDKMVGAPEKPGRISDLWTWSRKEHEERIEDLESRIEDCKAGRVYAQHLKGQLANLAKAETQLKQHQEVSLNTYETVSLASSLLNVLKKSIEDLNTIQSMELPDMLPLETDRIRSEFQIISKQLRGE